MKDKELRKLLERKGIIRLFGNGPELSNIGGVSEGLIDRMFKEIENLEAKLDAINEHYGVTVEHEDAKYVVKEIK